VSIGNQRPTILIETELYDGTGEDPSPKFHSRVQVDPELTEWRQQVLFYKRIQKKLLKDPSLLGKYVAIKDKTIIDSDICKFALARRVFQEYPSATILITKVERKSLVADIPSPEIVQ